jgi:hypothetical protein
MKQRSFIFNMSRYFFHFRWWRFNNKVGLLICSLIIFIYFNRRSANNKTLLVKLSPHPLLLSSNNRTHDFRLYPQSRSAIEYNRIQIDNIPQSMFSFHQNKQDIDISYSKPLNYSEGIFRSAPIPIIWLDAKGDVRWNHAAQYETLHYLLEKQFPNDNISTCLSRRLFILEQWGSGGFFSRHHSFIEHFGQTLYSPSMALASLTRFTVSNAEKEDFRSEGILRYYQSISLCSSHLNHPQLKTLRDRIQSIPYNLLNTKIINDVHELLDHDEIPVQFKHSRDIWKYGYEHVPHRRWLFDRNRKEIKNILNYHSPIKLFIDHSNEHIYYNHALLALTGWQPRNYPFGKPTNVLKG